MTEPPIPFTRISPHSAGLLLAALAVSCIGDIPGPNAEGAGRFQLVPSFESEAPSGIVPLDRVRITLARIGEVTPARDTTIRISASDTAVALTLSVPLASSADTFTASLFLMTPAGDIAFSGGPIRVMAVPPPRRPSPVAIPLRYTGIGAGADSVVITLAPPSVITGDTVRFQALAYDNDLPVPGTPIGWKSLDTARARVPQAATGRVVGRSQRGVARIVAQLLTGPADTGLVSVQPVPAAISIVSGNNQTSIVRTVLGEPLVAQIKADDSLGVAGVWVRFAVLAGGGSLSADSVLTDADGRAAVLWTLGPVAGLQQVGAGAARLPAGQLTYTATGLPGVPASIAPNDGNNQNGIVGTALAISPSVVVKDLDHNPVPNVPVTFAVESGGGSLTGAAQQTDAQGIARVGSWTLGTVPGVNTLTATAGGAAGVTLATTLTATAVAGPATSFVLAAFPATLTAGVPADLVVTAKDRYGNTATGYLGTVRFSSSDLATLLPPDYTFTAADSGIRAFAGGLTLLSAGAQTVTVTDVANPTLTGTITVTVAP
ncbi:MAG: hypothetical protein HY560_11445 [Gemmatimonadetes bacterium]|nr:hypothetical protein [Gemmatimonadota bacterium]